MSNGNSSAKDRPSVGRILQQARVDAKLTVDEVSSSTRVRIPIVQSIEQDDFSGCGGDVYARGHIRTLARAVGADAAELIELFNEQQATAPPLLSSGPLFEAERIRPEPRRPNWTAAMVAAIVVVIGFVGFTFFSGGEGEDPGAVAEGSESPSPTGETESEPPENTTEPEETNTPEPSESAVAAAAADKVTVRATAEGGSSWISAKDGNGGLIFQGVLEEGASETFTDDEQIDLIIGNAGAVSLHVNGSEIETAFEMGQVERLSYTPGDPSEG
ncbi:helix-turn-helix domain-containing protein [Streptomyces sp. SBT349]|uniref:helix-turn-helix domain-containing protein n=1 Tax=Streptomyces sp. SBT349 TaxID=1580539 RepID=UPI00066C22A2|nr:helix-turn-helix domain-containing protein [Streptomyces sp. SBT349]